MEFQPYLIFSLGTSLYGVDALAVQEIFFLPELIPIVEAPQDIVGMINLRGEILPVMDLNRRLGQPHQEYSLTDSIIVLEKQGLRIGIAVKQVDEVRNIDINDIKTDLSYGRNSRNQPTERSTTHQYFLAGVAKLEDNLILLLDCDRLLQDSAPVSDLVADSTTDSHKAANSDLFSHTTPEERAIFRERAKNLILSTETQDFAGLIPLAVIGLNGEYFGLDLKNVREFTDIRKVTPIPCCPPHIVGNMNLRGEIVTLFDIRHALNLEPKNASNFSKAMVIKIDELVAGITVDEVLDVMYVNPSEIKSVPTAIHGFADEYLRGTAPYREKMMGILDLPEILTTGQMDVNEEI